MPTLPTGRASHPSPTSAPHPTPLAPVRVVVRVALQSAAHSAAHRRRAQLLAWDWVAAKWPRLRPSLHEMESEHHEASMPGLELAMSNHDAAWTLSVAQTERQSPRVWMTRVTVADDGDTDLLALQTACTEMPHAPLVVAPPRLLGDWVDRLDLVDAGLAVLGQARTVTDDHELQAFCAHVLHPLRRLPVIALSNDPHSRFFGVDPRGLAEAVRGMAHVACVAPQVAASTAGRLGAEFGVASGAARIYAPGFGAGAAAAEHPLLRDGKDTGDRSVHDPGTFRRLLCQRLCAMSALRAPAGKSAQPA